MILNDAEIVAQIANGLLPAGMAQTADWFLKDSQVQPASLDLTVGLVFAPSTNENASNRPDLPVGKTEYILKPGRTAVVLTREELKMPNDLIAIGFPPSKQLSSQGILMTNPGQVDPGYQGRLRFTVINMGRKDFIFRQGDVIVSLILMRLKSPAQVDWLARHTGHQGGPIVWENLNRVADDFVEVEERARNVAKEEVAKADVKIKTLQTWVPVGVALLTLLGTAWVSIWQASWKDSLLKVQQDVAVLQSQADVGQLSKKVDELSKQAQDLQAQIKALQPKASQVPRTPPASKH